MKHTQKILTMMLILIFSSCQQEETAPVASGSNSSVTIQSGSYTNDGSVVQGPLMKNLKNLLLIPSAFAAPVTDFKFCITKLKVVSSVNGSPGNSQEAILGLVDVSNPNGVTDWGTIELADGSVVSEIHFELHRDPQNCSAAEYSTSYNGKTITKDLEFKFKFEPAISIRNGDTLTLGLSKIAKAMEDADVANKFNNTDIGQYMQANVIGTGSRE